MMRQEVGRVQGPKVNERRHWEGAWGAGWRSPNGDSSRGVPGEPGTGHLRKLVRIAAHRLSQGTTGRAAARSSRFSSKPASSEALSNHSREGSSHSRTSARQTARVTAVGDGHEPAHPRRLLQHIAAHVDRLAVATSFQASGLVILHLLRDIRPGVPVLFLDTGFHFVETLEFGRRIAELWELDVVELRGEHGSVHGQNQLFGSQLYRRDPDLCCTINKVQPLQRALEDYDGWISGLRRDQSPLRVRAPFADKQRLPSGREILTFHPLAHWTKKNVEAYVDEHNIPTNPLTEIGFASIGCWPCTATIGPDEDDRAGRWRGLSKSECGIHTFGRPGGPKETEAELWFRPAGGEE